MRAVAEDLAKKYVERTREIIRMRDEEDNSYSGGPPAPCDGDEETVEYWKDRALVAEEDIATTKRNLQKVQQRIMEAGMAVVQEFIDETI